MGVKRDVSSSPSLPSDTEPRKRSSKACDRCKLKKVKCCGSKPCSRCQSDDAVCRFGTTTKSDVKPVSAARANQLELQQNLLIKALRVLWKRYSDTHHTDDESGRDEIENPSVHDIIKSLGLVDSSQDSAMMPKIFEFDNQESSSNSSSETFPILNSPVGKSSVPPENSDITLTDHLSDISQRDQQMDYDFQSNVFWEDIDTESFALPDLSLFDDFNLENLSQQAMEPILSSISSRRGCGEMPTLGPLPSFNLNVPLGGRNEISPSKVNEQYINPNYMIATNRSQNTRGDWQSTRMIQGVKADEAFTQFTTLTSS